MNDLKASRHITRRDVPSARRLAERRAPEEHPSERPSGVHQTGRHKAVVEPEVDAGPEEDATAPEAGR